MSTDSDDSTATAGLPPKVMSAETQQMLSREQIMADRCGAPLNALQQQLCLIKLLLSPQSLLAGLQQTCHSFRWRLSVLLQSFAHSKAVFRMSCCDSDQFF